MRIVSVLSLTLAMFLSASAAHAQSLDGEWFKVTVSADGSGLAAEADVATKGKVKTLVRYARFALDEGGSGGPNYTVESFAPTISGSWMPFSLGYVAMLDPAETFVVASQFVTSTVPVPDEEGAPNLLILEFNGPAKLKFKNEELKSAQIRQLGVMALFSNDSYFSYGKGKITMTRVPVSKLPFDVAMVTKTDGERLALPALPEPVAKPALPKK